MYSASSPYSIYKNCNLCPRNCNIDRTSGMTGYCGESNVLYAARAALHYWEEPCISGEKGSGAVFFCGCNMRCVFCQNYGIAHRLSSSPQKAISTERLVEIFLSLQEQGAHNINLVTPTHYIPHIADALIAAKKLGLHIPIVYNTSGYEKVESLKILDGLIDIYLPDLKYHSSELSSKYSNAPDYFTVAATAIAEMYRQVGSPVFENSEDSLMKKGVIVRHLLLPGCEEDSRYLLHYLHETYHNEIYISIMNQYTPLEHVAEYPELSRKITDTEYDAMIDYAISIGIENGFIQEGETASESFIPPFDCEGL